MASESETMLVPCPMCGAKPEFRGYKANGLELRCSTMGCISLRGRVLRNTIGWLRAKMTEQWNRRTPSAEAKDAERWRVLQSMSIAEAIAGIRENGLSLRAAKYSPFGLTERVDAAIAQQDAQRGGEVERG